MTPWHRFWFPDDPAAPQRVPRDALLWSPTALAELQHALWLQATEATAEWWRFVSAAWPGLPTQPSPGQLMPPAPEPASPSARPAARRQKARTTGHPARPAPAAPRRPRSVARGK